MMGACLCKTDEENNENHVESTAAARDIRGGGAGSAATNKTLSETVDELVNETLDIIGNVIDNDPEPLHSIQLLHIITDRPAGWIELVRSLVRVVVMEHPMGPSVIALLLDDSPLPTRDSVLKVADMITGSLRRNAVKQRNLCVILGCLAEKLAGPSSIALLHDTTLKYLVGNLDADVDPNVKLLSLIALDKFAQTSENKATIRRALNEVDPNPLVILEQHTISKDYLLRQIGFCARWCLDNYFIIEGRRYSYETTDLTHINAMLNTRDVSEYLKISPDGLEARCDAYTFESVRCTFQTTTGCWYYEVELVTPGVMQIGWATKDSNFLSDDGYGIGDDKFSISFDGCRKLIWHNAKSMPHNLHQWRCGTILGCLLDLERREVIFTLDGIATEAYKQIFNSVNDGGFFAAASFMSFQQCRFNFGNRPFQYPPQRNFTSFNEFGTLTEQDKIVLPRHIYLDLLRRVSVCDDSCTLCFDRKANIRLGCQHRGFCATCIQQLEFCPMCRAVIKEKIQDTTTTTTGNINTNTIEKSPSTERALRKAISHGSITDDDKQTEADTA